MSDTASLLRKIDSAADLRAVVRSMKALAASSVGQYEKSVRALADYRKTVELGLSLCLRERSLGPMGDPPLRRLARRSVSVVVFGSDQGLVGKFNELIADLTLRSLDDMPSDARVWAVGSRLHERLLDGGREPSGLFKVPASVMSIGPLVGQILVECASDAGQDELSELWLLYNRPTLGASYEPTSERLLPLDEVWQQRLLELPWSTKRTLPEVFGTGGAVLGALIREHLFISLFRACAGSLASENASRLAAMQRADKNIEELLGGLHAASHRLRQSTIDEELFDVIAGFEALVTVER